MDVFTIGAGGRTAEAFFDPLQAAGVRRVVDVRLHNTSNLAGFARQAHLPYLLDQICEAEYVHVPSFTPTGELFDGLIRSRTLSWQEYERGFLELLAERRVEERVDRELLLGAPTALLCACRTPDRCHRRLVLEYLQPAWGPFAVRHL